MTTTVRGQARKLRVLACEACRSRRTRCDGRKPACKSCESRGCSCQYPKENKRAPTANVEDELLRIRSQLDRIENVVTASTTPPQESRPSVSQSWPAAASSPWMPPPSSRYDGSTVSASPGTANAEFPFMKLQTASFTQMAGLGDDYGNMVIRLEQTAGLATTSSSSMFVLQHNKVMTALQNFSTRIHPWYPILEDRFSDCISSFLAKSFERGTDAFLVLMVLASGTVVQEASHSSALDARPDATYLNAAMEMLHLVILEQSLRSVQCLVAASIHYYLLLKPLQAHDLIIMAIKKAQNLQMSEALQHDQAAMAHWIRVYRIALLIEGELVVPLRLVDSNAWETEEDIALPTATEIWSFEGESQVLSPGSTETSRSARSDDVIAYLLAEIAMRRMLRRNTTAMSFSSAGTAEYAPLIAKELETQLEQWFTLLPEPLRFSREYEDTHNDTSLQTAFLRTQYWACMVSFYWPAVVQAMETQQLTEMTSRGCVNYFRSFQEFVKSATAALGSCLPNKWTLYASIFAISLGAFMGASNTLLASIATNETWQVLALARDAFGDECRGSPSLALMAESLRTTLSGVGQS